MRQEHCLWTASNYTLGLVVNLATDEYRNTKVHYAVCCSFAFDLCHLYDLHSSLWLKFLWRSTHGMLPLGEAPICCALGLAVLAWWQCIEY